MSMISARPRRSVVALSLAGSVLASLGCSGGELAFHGEGDVLGAFEHDTGLQPGGSPVQVRALARGHGTVSVDARATAAGSALTAVPASGSMHSSGGLSIEIYARIDTLGIEYDGLVHTVEYQLPAEGATFDPFLLAPGESAATSTTLPEAELARVPIPSAPGATLVLGIAGGTVETAFTGTCAAVDAGRAHYRGRLTTTGTIDLSATVEISVPVVGSRSFGPFALGVPIPAIEHELDLGVLDIASGARVDGGPAPCDAAPPAGDGGIGPADASIRPGDAGVLHGDADTGARDGSILDDDGGEGGVSRPVFWLGPGFSPDPAITVGRAGGPIDASTLSSACNGWYAYEPSHLLNVGEAFSYLRIVANGGPGDLTLGVIHPDGSFDCNDDFDGSNPMIEGAFAVGEHQIYVGTYAEDAAGAPYRIGISQLTSTTPTSIGAP